MRLEMGERLMQSLKFFIQELNVKGAWINGLGAVTMAELGYYQLSTRQYIWREVQQPLEMLTLQGNITVGDDGQAAIHMHGTFSDAAMHAFGGHVKDAEIGATAELLITIWNKEPLHRQFDEPTGLSLLQL